MWLTFLPYLIPLGWAGYYACPALRSYKFGLVCSLESEGHISRLNFSEFLLF